MSAVRHVIASRPPARVVSGLAIVAALMLAPTLQAAQLGHSRLVSQAGQPLQIDIPVAQLSAAEADTLHATPAQEAAWQAAGLKPPVPLSSLHIELKPAPSGNGHVLQVSSAEIFNQPVADLLLDIRSAEGEQRFQVSLLAQSDPAVVRAPVAASAVSGMAPSTQEARAGAAPVASSITVRPGDTMFAIAQRHAVAGVSEYQLMMALQRANPQAFINDNVNLVKAGASLAMPDSAALSALSDRAARRLFHQHVVAFEQGRHVATDDEAIDEPQAIDMGDEAAPAPQPAPESEAPTQAADHTDQLIDTEPGTPAETADTEPGTPAKATDAEPSTAAPKAESSPDPAPAAETSEEPAAHTDATPRTQDQLKLSSALGVMSEANAAEPPAADDHVAESKAIAEAEERVSQLEENVKNLNRALQSQGEAAKDLVLDGAQELRQSLSEVATAVSEAAKREAAEAKHSLKHDAQEEQDTVLPSDADPTDHGTVDKSVSSAEASSTPATDSADASPDIVPDTPVNTHTPVAADTAAATQTSPDAKASADVDAAATPDTAEPGTATPDAAESDAAEPTIAKTDAAEPDAASDQAAASALSPKPAAVQSMASKGVGGWLWEHIYVVLAAGLGMILAFMVWVFWSASRRQARQTAAITPEMVQEKLDQIDLDLNRPADGDGPGRS